MTRSLPLTIDTADSVNSLETNAQKSQGNKKKFALLQAVQRLTNKPASFEEIPHPEMDSNIINHNSAKQIETNRKQENEIEEGIESNAELPPPPPYDDEQSSESLNQHTNFIFNWHARNRDISAIEPLQKPELNLLNIAVLSDLQKPLIFGAVAGTLLLSCIVLLYFCMLRHQRAMDDKAALIDDDSDIHTGVVALPPAAAVATQTLTRPQSTDEVCRSVGNCSRNALKV